MESSVVRDHAHAVELATRAIKTLDTKPLEPFVAAMLMDAHKAAISAMTIAQAEPDLLTQFLVVCEDAGLLCSEECHRVLSDFVDAQRKRVA